MPGVLVIGAEGVILNADENFGASHPIQDGLAIVHQLSEFPTSRIVVIAHLVGTQIGFAEHWLKVNGLLKAQAVGVAPEDEGDPIGAQWMAIQRLRSHGPVGLVITGFVDVYKECTKTFQPVMLYGRRGVLGSPGEIEAWDDISDRAIRHRDAEVENLYEEVERPKD